MNNMKINIPEGFEIDKENSSLETGDIVFKEIESKYTSEFEYNTKRNGLLSRVAVSEKYADKLNTLDTLLCLRDEYNRIDGFEEGFRLGEQNWCILHYKFELKASIYVSMNRIMHISMNTENYKDFEVNFTENQSAMVNTEFKCWRETSRLLEWYFIKQAGNRKLPFDKSVIKALFKLKYNNGETKNTRKRKHENIDYEQYEN